MNAPFSRAAAPVVIGGRLAATPHAGAPAAPQRLCRSHQLVFDVLDARRANGYADTTDFEIQEMLERLHAPRRFDRAWISGRISEMKALGVVLEATAKRHDAHTSHINSNKVRATYLPRLAAVRGPSVIAAGAAREDCY